MWLLQRNWLLRAYSVSRRVHVTLLNAPNKSRFGQTHAPNSSKRRARGRLPHCILAPEPPPLSLRTSAIHPRFLSYRLITILATMVLPAPLIQYGARALISALAVFFTVSVAAPGGLLVVRDYARMIDCSARGSVLMLSTARSVDHYKRVVKRSVNSALMYHGYGILLLVVASVCSRLVVFLRYGGDGR